MKRTQAKEGMMMKSKPKRRILAFLSPISNFLPDFIEHSLIRFFSRKLQKGLGGELTDECFEFLLRGMEGAFCVSKGYRKNIKGFRGAYLFRTRDNVVVNSVTFDQSKMTVHEDAVEDWDIRVTLKDVRAFWKFIFSRDHDILNLVLANEVEIEGNLNYIYRFGFFARDLVHRLEVWCP